jgi:hypothetical protein
MADGDWTGCMRPSCVLLPIRVDSVNLMLHSRPAACCYTFHCSWFLLACFDTL